MKIPAKFEKILKENQVQYSIVLDAISTLEPILKDNKLYFFEEYTDHGIHHIEQVLEAAEFLITEESFKSITPNEIAILILAIILHDLGMHTELATFNTLLNGGYDHCRTEILNDISWSKLWSEYISEVKRFSSVQRKNIFGNENTIFSTPNLSDKDSLTGIDKKLIGEFIRRHHGRFAHEIALSGLKAGSNYIPFGSDKLDKKHKQLIGILARSHSMNIRDTFPYLEDIAHDSWRNPLGINIIYLMVIIRIADYIQIDSSRVNPFLLKLKSFSSPISQLENLTHLSVTSLSFNQPDAEKIYVDCTPNNSEMYIKIKNLLFDIQNEFDKSWAILGEVYGFIPHNKPSIKFRRITSNLENKNYLNKLEYIPEKVTFKVDHNLSKLLVGPLYGNNPTFGVRELLQNSIDSCIERKQIEDQNGNKTYKPTILVSIERINEDFSLFTIKDNGKGMSRHEIINYFLSVGTSFRKSMEWKKKFVDEGGNSTINRNGKFGIGVLASFLLGDEIKVETKNIDNEETYSFEAKIDTQFINILKKENGSFGTIITILINNEKRNDLLKPDFDYRYDAIEWTDWYLYDYPEIIFKVDNKDHIKKQKYPLNNFFKFKSEHFEKIEWAYLPTKKNEFDKKMVACNGIIITENYSPSFFIYSDDQLDKEDDNYNNYYRYYRQRGHVILQKPSILVTDREGIFPVKLDRNDLDCYELPFEDDLLSEVSKNYIAQILTLDISPNNFKETNIHESSILYGVNGYTFNFDYFMEGIGNDFNLIKLITEDNYLNINTSQFQTCLFYINFNEKINLSYQERNVGTINRTGARILLPITKYKSLFDTPKRLPVYLKRETIIEEKNKDYVIYNIYGYNSKPILLKNIREIDKDLLSKVNSIQEVGPDFFKLKGGIILNNHLAKYIKNNFIIPYDLNERKEVYKEAFQDLAEFMK
jgi:molecular chaperone HtpG